MNPRYRQIKHAGWRYTAANWLLRLLYGPRPNYYVYPWPQGGIAAAAVLTHQQKVMLQLRSGANEADGCWGLFGGYSDPTTEVPHQALTRELIEECGLTLPVDTFCDHNMLAAISTFNKPMAELATENHLSVFWHYALSAADIKQMRPLDETGDFKLFSWAEVQQLWDTHQIHQSQTPNVYRACQIAYEKGLIT